MFLGQEPCAGNDDVVGPEAEGEEVEGDVYGMAVKVPRGNGHQDWSKHWVHSQRGDDQQPVQPFSPLFIISVKRKDRKQVFSKALMNAFEFFKHLL